MIVDASAVVAMIGGVRHAERLFTAIVGSTTPVMSSATYLETSIVVDRRPDPALSRRLDQLMSALEIAVVPFTGRQAIVARQAYRDFGKGSGHRAALNLGDCFSYALAIDKDEPLLFVGNDFQHTDVRIARY